MDSTLKRFISFITVLILSFSFSLIAVAAETAPAESNTQKAIKKAGSRKFWEIWPYLPAETRGYVPALIGVMYAMHYHNEYGIEPVAIEMPAQTDTFKINKKLHLKQVSEMVGISLEDLKKYNPQYIIDIIPGNEKEYILRLPHQYSNTFIEKQDTIYKHKEKEFFDPLTIKKVVEVSKEQQAKEQNKVRKISYEVKSGDCLSAIAAKYRDVTIDKIKKWNNLKSDNLSLGQKLILHTPGLVDSKKTGDKKTTTPKTTTSTGTQKKTNSAAGAKGHTTYTVKDGDTFYSIAKNYPGVSAQNIMDYNKRETPNLRPGEVIKIPKF